MAWHDQLPTSSAASLTDIADSSGIMTFWLHGHGKVFAAIQGRDMGNSAGGWVVCKGFAYPHPGMSWTCIAVERNGSLELDEKDMKDLLYDHGYCYYCI